jgi:hypothetical protein
MPEIAFFYSINFVLNFGRLENLLEKSWDKKFDHRVNHFLFPVSHLSVFRFSKVIV